MKNHLLNHSIDASIVADIIDASYQFPDFDLVQLRDALSTGQLMAKLWIEDEILDILPEDDIKILIVGGWIGTLSRILLSFLEKYYSHSRYHVTTLDIDQISAKMAQIVNKRFPISFTSLTQNMYTLTVEDYDNYNVIINTSCEHILHVQRWSDVIPPGKIIVAQSNDFFSCPQHVNCVHAVQELREQLNLSTVLYEGSKELEGMYTRFMVIGVK